VFGALWLRSPEVRYLVAAGAATLVAAVLAATMGSRGRTWAVGATAATAVLCISGVWTQRRLELINRDWPSYRAALLRAGQAAMITELERSAASLRGLAQRGLDAPAATPAAFRYLSDLPDGLGARGVVLWRDGRAVAWGGRMYVPIDSLSAPIGIARTAFYVTLYVTARRGDTLAVATEVLRAEPPTNRLVDGLAAAVADRFGIPEYDLPLAPGMDVGVFVHRIAGVLPLVVQPRLPSQEQAGLDALERARTSGAVLLGIGFACLIVGTWRRETQLVWRLVPLAAGVAAVGALPLNTLSNSTSWLDPTVYVSDVGGPFTASIGTLALTGSLMLVAILPLLRTRFRLTPAVAVVIVLSVISLGPLLVRALAAGIAPPPGGVTTEVWLGWEVALFTPIAALLVAAAAAGSSLVGRDRGLPPWLAALTAGALALSGPVVVGASGEWPSWYAAAWLLPVLALTFSRPNRTVVLTASIVAACGAATITWQASLRGRVQLAEHDVASLDVPDSDVVQVLGRLADSLASAPPARSDAELLQRYVRSDLAGIGVPVNLSTWTAAGLQATDVELAALGLPPSSLAAVVQSAHATGLRRIEAVAGAPGTYLMLAVPHRDGSTTAVTVAPRTRLIPDNPYVALLGLAPRESGDPPYQLTRTEADSAAASTTAGTRWYREDNTLHGDRVLRSSRGVERVHIEVELRSLGIVAQRGVLVVLLDVVIVAALWLLATVPERAFVRWTRVRLRRALRSYRSRLTLALFAFFVLPEIAFGLWSYERLRSEDRQSRDLLLRETLRSVSGYEQPERLDVLGGRIQPPLLLYQRGSLVVSSIGLYASVAPTGRFLPPVVEEELAQGTEEYRSVIEPVGEEGESALFGFRATRDIGGNSIVLGAPARENEESLERRRHDLGVLVLFATVLGAAAALWLSGVAARSLAQPIGRLRGAALAIAAGEREPPLEGTPPEEFAPVFSAFRRMAADLGESRAALESAQRRTAAVLRNVASGVLAVSARDGVTLANPRAEALLGASLLPGTPLERVTPALSDRLRAFLDATDDEEEFEIALGDRQIQARLTRLAGSGGAVLTLDDVTELARAQRVLAWGEMARQVAHEIKNPLTPIRLGVQHLKRARADARGDFDRILDQNVERILAEIDRLDEIARGFSRYGTAPEERLPAEPTDVAAVLRDVVSLERMAPGEVEWQLVGADKPVSAMARSDELREVMLNVLENARLAGARRVSVCVDRNDGVVQLEVRDDGKGIPASVLPRIFEPHFSTRTSGSGLGLAISRRLVEGWGGEIAIKSTEGQGTTVRVELRCKD